MHPNTRAYLEAELKYLRDQLQKLRWRVAELEEILGVKK